MEISSDNISIDEEGASVMMNRIIPDAIEEVSEAEHGGEADLVARKFAHKLAQVQVELGDKESKSTAIAGLNDIANNHKALTRKEVKSDFYDRVDELRRQKQISQGEMFFADLIAETMTDVTKHVTTDTVETVTFYEFRFEVPASAGGSEEDDDAESSSDESGNNSDSEEDGEDAESSISDPVVAHDDGNDEVVRVVASEDETFSKKRFWRKFIGSTSNHYPQRKQDKDDEEERWDNHMGSLIEEVGETVKESIGQRTGALMHLAGKMNQSPAFGNLRDAVEESGVYVDSAPPNHEEIWIPHQLVGETKRNEDISGRKMQLELDRRDLNALSGQAVRQDESLSDRKVTVWKVKSEFLPEFVRDADDGSGFSPFAGFAESAESSSDRMDAAVRKARGQAVSDDSDGSVDDNGDADADADADDGGGSDGS